MARRARSIASILLTLPAVAAGSVAGQFGGAWALQPGWQVVQDHPTDPDVFVVGLYGEPHVDPGWSQAPGNPARQARQRTDRLVANAGRMPRLALRCEEGTTSLLLLLPGLSTAFSRAGRAANMRSVFDEGFKVVLDFGDRSPIEIDVRNSPRYRSPAGNTVHFSEPVYVPDPFDTIGRLRRHDVAFFVLLLPGDPLWLDYRGDGAPPGVDAVLPLEGLDDLLRATRDPCGWRSS